MAAAPRSAPRGWPAGIGLLACLAALCLQALMIFWPVQALVDRVFERDDAFYYFQLARSLAAGGPASFDGIHLTNGVQLLWGLILVPLAWPIDDRVLYLRTVLGLCLALNACVAVQLYALGRRIHSPAAGDLAALFWAGLLIEKWNTLEGMEFSLHMSVIVALVHMAWPVLVGKAPARTGRMLGLGALLTLNYWARLDAVLFSAALWGALAWAVLRGGGARLAPLCALTLIPALGALAYIATSHALAGTWLPVSGSVKTVYARHFFDGAPEGLAVREELRWWLKIEAGLFLALLPEALADLPLGAPFNPFHDPASLGLMVLAAGVLLGGSLLIGRDARARAALPLLWGLFLVGAVHAAVLVLSIGDFAHVSRHYYGWLLFFWLIFGALALAVLLERLPRPAALGFALLFLLACLPGTARYLRPGPIDPAARGVSRLALAARLNRTLPRDTIAGAWNAGVIGYFLNVPVVNLDGLMNDGAFLERLRAGAPLLPYLKREGIGVLIDHDQRDLTARFHEDRGAPGSDYRNLIPWARLREIDREGDILVLQLLPG